MKTSKSNPGGVATRGKKKLPDVVKEIKEPPPIPENMVSGKYFDCSVAIMSRQYERDRDTVIKRARNCGVSGLICWFTDIEKQTELADCCKMNSGLCYFATGILPDNVDRTNKKQDEILLSRIHSIACRSECVGITSGLNLSRDMGSHYAQELLFFGCYYLAAKCSLPLILHCNDDGVSMEKALDLLEGTQLQDYISRKHASEGAKFELKPVNVIFHDVIRTCKNNGDVLQRAVDLGCYFIVASLGCPTDDSSCASNIAALLHSIPPSRLLLASNSPWCTPQCIADEYIRNSKNEPSNMEYRIQDVWEAYQREQDSTEKSVGAFESVDALTRSVYTNSLNVFGLIPSAVVATDRDSKERSDSIGESRSRSGSVGRCRSGSIGNSIPKMEKSSADSNSLAVENELQLQNAEKPQTEEGEGTASKVSYYSCKRCRAKLFDQTQLVKHAKETDSATVFDVDTSICESIHFLDFYVSNDMLANANAKKDELKRKETAANFPYIAYVPPKEVKCSECNVKFGQYFEYDSKCLCGATIPGPGVKVSHLWNILYLFNTFYAQCVYRCWRAKLIIVTRH